MSVVEAVPGQGSQQPGLARPPVDTSLPIGLDRQDKGFAINSTTASGLLNESDTRVYDSVPRTIGLLTDSKVVSIVSNSVLLQKYSKQVDGSLVLLRERKVRNLLREHDEASTGVVVDIEEKRTADEVSEWGATKRRHAVLQAVHRTRDLGKVYYELLLERTGFTTDQLKELVEDVPPWKESTTVLTEDQRLAAEAICARILLKKCEKVATGWVENQEGKKDKKLIEQEVTKLLQAHVRIQQDQQGSTPQERWADLQAGDMLDDLEIARNKVFDKSQYWTAIDKKRKIRSVGGDFKGDERVSLLLDIAGITPDMITEANKGKKKELAVTIALAGGNELVSHAPGVAAVLPSVNLQEQFGHNPWVLTAATALLYTPLVGLLVRNSFLTGDLLKMTGISLDPWSKRKFDRAVDNEKAEAVKGALEYHGGLEGIFYFLALAIAARYGWEAALTYFNVATVSGIAKNSAVNLGLEITRAIKKRRNKEE